MKTIFIGVLLLVGLAACQPIAAEGNPKPTGTTTKEYNRSFQLMITGSGKQNIEWSVDIVDPKNKDRNTEIIWKNDYVPEAKLPWRNEIIPDSLIITHIRIHVNSALSAGLTCYIAIDKDPVAVGYTDDRGHTDCWWYNPYFPLD